MWYNNNNKEINVHKFMCDNLLFRVQEEKGTSDQEGKGDGLPAFNPDNSEANDEVKPLSSRESPVDDTSDGQLADSNLLQTESRTIYLLYSAHCNVSKFM